MLVFRTETELPVEALRLMGASTKADDETKIGFYGTGFKYALATFLREGIDFRILVNDEEIFVTSQKVEMRGEEFDEVYVNGLPTSYTTRVGVDWQPWQAVREIWQNTVDEGGEIEMSDTYIWDAKNDEGTMFIIDDTQHPEMQNLSEKWTDYFRPTEWDGIQQKDGLSSLAIFFKGMRCTPLPGAGEREFSLFDYGIQRGALNEIRMILDHSAESNISMKMARHFTADDWRFFLNHDQRENTIEWEIFNSGRIYARIVALEEVLYEYKFYPDNWKDTVPAFPKPIFMSYEGLRRMMDMFPNGLYALNQGNYTKVECNQCLDKVLKVMMKIHDVTGLRLPALLELGDFLDEEVYGVRIRDKIAIAHMIPERYPEELWTTVLEEMVHLTTGHADNTRGLQTYLFNTLAGALEKGMKIEFPEGE